MIDLDSARAARREAAGKGPVLKYGGKEYQLAPEVSFEAIEALALLEDPETTSRGLIAVGRALLGDHYDAITHSAGFAVPDLELMMEKVLEEYGMSAPSPSDAS